MVDAAKPTTATSTTQSATAANPATPTTAASGTVTQQATTGGGMPTVDQLSKICPEASRQNLIKYFPLIAREMVAGNLLTKNQLVAILASIYVETRSFAPIKEAGASGARYAPYVGRGFLQLTWKDNYIKAGKALGVDLVNNMDLAMQPELAAKITVWDWRHGNSTSIEAYAERQDWQNVRSILNAGSPGRWRICNGKEVFMAAIQRGLAVLTSGLDPKAVGSSALPGNYGMGCVDTGGAPLTTLSGTTNPGSGADALVTALGLHMQQLSRAITFEGYFDVHAQSELLDAEPQKTFEGKGFGEEFDTTYTFEEVVFLADDTLEVEIVAHAGDPLPPMIQTFSNNAPSTAEALTQTAGTTGATTPGAAAGAATGATPVAAGDGSISARIYGHAMKAFEEKRSSAAGPGGGNVACAWVVNNFFVIPAGLKAIGDNPNYVPSMETALKGGRGQLIPRGQAIPGDIWIAPNTAHVGICTEAGCTKVLSNSSSKAKVTWLGSISSVNRFYGSESGERIYRVVN